MFELVSDLARIGVWECDLATDALRWTDRVYDLFDLPRGLPVERSEVLDRYEPGSLRRLEQLRSEAIRDGTGFQMDVCIRAADGSDRWIRITARVEQEDGRPARLFGTKQDITSERAAQEKARSLQSELIHVSRFSAMGAMGSMLAHEVNQPLAAIASYLAGARRLAAAQAVTSELGECIAAAENAALRAGEIIRRVRDMIVRGPGSRTQLEIEPVVREAVLLATAGRPDVAFAYDIEPGAAAFADRIQVQQVLINLVRNACDAAGGGPCRIGISAVRRGTFLELCVSDDGPGISGAVLHDVFGSFVTTKVDALGIGLSISRTIVEAHGGQIRAANRPEGGASFCFTLPVAASQAPEMEAAE